MKAQILTLLSLVIVANFSVGAEELKLPLEFNEIRDSEDNKAMLNVLTESGINNPKRDDSKVGEDARIKKVGEAAFKWGIKEGQYHYQIQYSKELEKYDSKLSQFANFSQFIVDGRLLLPKVSLAERLFEKVANTKVREVGFSITIEQPAKLVSAPPTWRDYLNFHIDKPLKPSAVFLPRSPQEDLVFNYEFKRGWELGRSQAEVILEEGFSRLIVDLENHYNFIESEISNVLRMPTIRTTEMGVVVSADGRTLYGDDVIFTIDQKTTFKSLENWTPIFVSEEE
ncbi:type IV secretory system conjugative DNA transfer family protein [Alteromonas macleodii]|jgi:defect-in-organelle-trafficking protein DotC|uniref:Uncharacterized protein n=1 Tax=Alteromonas macleodii TaxID=28108 RepID=A0AB36FLH2_ALTMA|nr:type IV secretory system conjugative DNA transfer family protein [Alteromonas macleodii]OES23864.1 hypothetical protein BFV95_4949 [Alteromonas macleodii]OES24569.1 hypothetical protein BFV94_4720 [Alteromonas macleodii]OES25580.1 hypothetical protein BFV93_4334 [Alteromonas macleodii]OES38988.1 hypothetical protein BFV96_4389 [Alteromonas macleodii]|tara:strand:+ start:209 stop:1060 length:852 start_codon:yes stop_codon:yes gene_type:complete